MRLDPLQEMHQKVSRQLIQISAPLKQIVQDQLHILGLVTVDNVFNADFDTKRLYLVNHLFSIQVHTVDSTDAAMIGFHAHLPQHLQAVDYEVIRDFFFNTVEFHARQRKAYHALYLQTRVQIFRQKLIEQVFSWIDGEKRVERFLNELDLEQAAQLDDIFMQHEYYSQPYITQVKQQGVALPMQVLSNLKHVCLLSSVYGQRFLPVHELMKRYETLCFEQVRFLGESLYRLAQIFFPQGFTLNKLLEKQAHLSILAKHAEQYPHMIAYAQLMQPKYWTDPNLLCKANFQQVQADLWQKQHNFSAFYYSRTVNWLFKQSALVNDWIAHHLSHQGMRCAVTALSFVDTSQIHPQVILMTLRYFQHCAGSMFIQNCFFSAQQQNWFDPEKNHDYELKDDQRSASQAGRIFVSKSTLYLEEWLNLSQFIVGDDIHAAKKLYLRMSRVMQAYMLYLQQIVDGLPEDLIAFIDPSSHENRGFYQSLQAHQIEVSHFREQFDLVERQTRESVFDAYVRDYLVDLFNQDLQIPKTVTWTGLFSRAVAWHDAHLKEDILSRLKKDMRCSEWAPVTQTWFDFDAWRFEEMHSLDRIVDESKVFRHCLAASYTQRIIEQEYIAYHFYKIENEQEHYTLGCILKDGVLYFDQCEAPRNQKASSDVQMLAKRFIDLMNRELHRATE